ncbi:MAG: outer membrane lipoprotein-sorting protein [Verrucomicrobiota bacterium]|nr:outer membrane lipoprotein-sorting protein [Verrucomicrobiota bacterium]
MLAEQLRSREPEENSEIGAVLKIRSKNKKMTEIPVICKILTSTNHWDTIYETAATPQIGAEKLIVRHFTNAPNQYFHARAENSSDLLPELESLSPAGATIPLAGSDFWLTDLGLDFLHWPEQRRLKGELRLNQSCYVLESSDPDGEEIVRVKSWIDKKSNGILVAEAYNRKKQKVKEFSLSGSSFKKIKGHWQLEKMDIHNAKTGSQTTLKFNLPK